MFIQTRIMANGKDLNIGEFDTETGTWYIKRNREKHFHRKLNAWGLDYKMYDHLKTEYGISKVVINADRKYEIDYKDIEKHKIFKEFKPHRRQIFIEEKYWRQICKTP